MFATEIANKEFYVGFCSVCMPEEVIPEFAKCHYDCLCVKRYSYSLVGRTVSRTV